MVDQRVAWYLRCPQTNSGFSIDSIDFYRWLKNTILQQFKSDPGSVVLTHIKRQNKLWGTGRNFSLWLKLTFPRARLINFNNLQRGEKQVLQQKRWVKVDDILQRVLIFRAVRHAPIPLDIDTRVKVIMELNQLWFQPLFDICVFDISTLVEQTLDVLVQAD